MFNIAKIQTALALALIVSVVATTSVMALLTTQTTISGAGSIKTVGVGVYWDLACTNATSSVNFGLVEPGGSSNFTLYLKNSGNSPLTLNMITQNWSPSTASNYMTLTWNREAQQINPNQVLQFLILLSALPNATGFTSYSFSIVITGTG